MDFLMENVTFTLEGGFESQTWREPANGTFWKNWEEVGIRTEKRYALCPIFDRPLLSTYLKSPDRALFLCIFIHEIRSRH